MTKSGENVSIALHHGVNAEHQLYRLKRGTLLRLVPGPSLLGRNVALYCNYPVTGECATIADRCSDVDSSILFL